MSNLATDSKTSNIQPRTALGNRGEKLVADFLVAKGYVILAHNFRWRGGEIDIIARKHDVIAFVEVKTRLHDYTTAAEMVPPVKQRKLIVTAARFCTTLPINDMSLRFDVACVRPTIAGPWDIAYFPNAFTD